MVSDVSVAVGAVVFLASLAAGLLDEQLGDDGDGSGDQDPVETLRQRYATGEISRAHFESRLEALVDEERERVRIELVEECHGIGDRTADAILDYYDVRSRDGLVTVVQADGQDLTAVPGVGPDREQQIEQQFQ